MSVSWSSWERALTMVGMSADLVVLRMERREERVMACASGWVGVGEWAGGRAGEGEEGVGSGSGSGSGSGWESD
jgi:hypothetical protein